jgi:fatty-acyl-CoA synthase
MNIQPDDKICIPVPLYHCFGCVLGNMVALTHGATMVYPSESFDPAAAVQAVSKEKCAALYGVPTMFIAMLDEMKNHKDLDFSNVRTGIMAGSICPQPLMERVINEMGISEMTVCYG